VKDFGRKIEEVSTNSKFSDVSSDLFGYSNKLVSKKNYHPYN
jgi:hypothetical protein